MKLTHKQLLTIIENLTLERGNGNELLEEIYKISHLANENCNHPDWEEQAYNRYILGK